MGENRKKTNKSVGAVRASNCEDCVYYDYDELTEEYSCQKNLDEDEMERFIRRENKNCPYYKYYDEYKSVQKQN